MDVIFNTGGALAVKAFEQVAVSTTVVTLTAATYSTTSTSGSGNDGTNQTLYRDKAKRAVVTVAGNSIRVRLDGTDPDANTGHLFAAGSSFELTSQRQIERFKAIRESADATIAVTYFS